MSETASETTAAATSTATSGGTTADVGYSLVSTYPTVQVLTPTTINNVVVCGIATQPSGVRASKPVQQKVFDSGQSGASLLPFAQAIEQVMQDPRVTGATGTEIRDDSGLIEYFVAFDVTYTDPVKAPYGASAPALVGVGQLDFTDALIGRTLLAGITQQIDGVYANLQAAAGG